MHADKRRAIPGRGMVGKTAVVGLKDRSNNRIQAEVIERADTSTLQDFVLRRTTEDATVYTDEAAAYRGLPRDHARVNHAIGEYVNDKVSTNGMESHWALMKRGLNGTYHAVSPKHLQRYVDEFSGRHNQRPMDTKDQMVKMARSGAGKRLTYKKTRRRLGGYKPFSDIRFGANSERISI